MDIKQLKYFMAIAEHRQITAAANYLHMAQPPLSQQLKLMELELGVRLVERKGKFVELTEAGTTLYRYACTITKYMEEAETEVRQIGEGVRGTLSIGVNTLSDYRLPDVLASFRAKYPSITYKIQQNESAQLYKLIQERAVELAIVRLPLRGDEDFGIVELPPDQFVFVTAGEPSGAGSVTYEQIAGEPLLLPSTEGLGLFRFFREQFERRKLNPNLVGECTDIGILLRLVAAGFGGTIVPETVLRAHRGLPLRYETIADSDAAASSAVIWLKRHYLSKPAEKFVELLSDMLGQERMES